jgi:hypothetical protein
VYGGDGEIIAIFLIYRVPLSAYFVCKSQITQPQTVVGQVASEMSVSMVSNG